MAITYVGASTFVSRNTSGNLTPDLSALALEQGDLLVGVCLRKSTSGTADEPSGAGWLKTTFSPSSRRLFIFSNRWKTGDDTTPDFNSTSSAEAGMQILVFRGARQAGVFWDVISGTAGTGTGTTMTAPTVTATVSAGIKLRLFASSDNNVASSPSEGSIIIGAASAGNNIMLAASFDALGGSGAIGTATVAQDASDDWCAISMVVGEAVAYGDFPEVMGVETSGDTTPGTTMAIDLPVGRVPNAALLMFIGTDGSDTVTTPSGWTLVDSTANGSSVRLSAYKKLSDGNEATTVSVTKSGSNSWDAICYLVDNWAEEITHVAAGTASTSNPPDPPSLSPAWGSDNTLWFAVSACATSSVFSAGPSGYSGYLEASSLNSSMAAAYLQVAGSSEDPGVFTESGSAFTTNTYAVRPVIVVVETRSANDGAPMGGASAVTAITRPAATDAAVAGSATAAATAESRAIVDGTVVGGASVTTLRHAREIADGLVAADAGVQTIFARVTACDGTTTADAQVYRLLAAVAIADGATVGASAAALATHQRTATDGAMVGATGPNTAIAGTMVADGGAVISASTPATAYARPTAADGTIAGSASAITAAQGRVAADGTATGAAVALTLTHSRVATDGTVVGNVAPETILALVVASDGGAVISASTPSTKLELRAASDGTLADASTGLAYAVFRSANDGSLAGSGGAVTALARPSAADGGVVASAATVTAYARPGAADGAPVGSATAATAYARPAVADGVTVGAETGAASREVRVAVDSWLVATGASGITYRAVRVAEDGATAGSETGQTRREVRSAADGATAGDALSGEAVQYSPAPAARTIRPSRRTSFTAGERPSPIWQAEGEVVRYGIDWTPVFGAAGVDGTDALTSVAWSVAPVDDSLAGTVDVAAAASGGTSGQAAFATLSGLFSGAVYRLTCRATTASGRIDEHTLAIICSAGPIAERVQDDDALARWSWDWSDVLAPGETITAATFTVSDGLTASLSEFDAELSSVTLTASGFTGVQSVTASITTTASRVFKNTLALRMQQN